MTLKHEIQAYRDVMFLKQIEIETLRKKIKLLEDSRVDCEHNWDNTIKGYEHEGVHCIKCGINDMYAMTLKKMLNKGSYK